MEATSANVHNIAVALDLIRDDDDVVYGDSGYLGIEERTEIVKDQHLSKIKYRINRHPHSLPKTSNKMIDWACYIENRKSSSVAR